MYIFYKIYLQWVYWTLFFIARCSTIFRQWSPRGAMPKPYPLSSVSSAPISPSASPWWPNTSSNGPPFTSEFRALPQQLHWSLVSKKHLQRAVTCQFECWEVQAQDPHPGEVTGRPHQIPTTLLWTSPGWPSIPHHWSPRQLPRTSHHQPLWMELHYVQNGTTRLTIDGKCKFKGGQKCQTK